VILLLMSIDIGIQTRTNHRAFLFHLSHFDSTLCAPPSTTRAPQTPARRSRPAANTGTGTRQAPIVVGNSNDGTPSRAQQTPAARAQPAAATGTSLCAMQTFHQAYRRRVAYTLDISEVRAALSMMNPQLVS